MENEPVGPSEQNLEKLFNQMPGMVRGVIEGLIGGKGSPASVPRNHFCPACLKHWGKRLGPTQYLKRKMCKPCRADLKSGFTIFTCMDGRSIKLKPKAGADIQINPKWVGKILSVPADFMDRLMPSAPPDTTATPAAG